MALLINLKSGNSISPETMDLLIRFAEYRDICDECGLAIRGKTGAYCATGRLIFYDIIARPDVKYVDEKDV